MLPPEHTSWTASGQIARSKTIIRRMLAQLGATRDCVLYSDPPLSYSSGGDVPVITAVARANLARHAKGIESHTEHRRLARSTSMHNLAKARPQRPLTRRVAFGQPKEKVLQKPKSARCLRPLLLLAFLAGLPGSVLAQPVALPAPPNSHAKSYGGDWECDYGFRAAAGACAAITIPADAHSVDLQLWTWLGLQSRLSRGRPGLRSHTCTRKRPLNLVQLRA